jgi:hypothetical protein
MKILKRQCKEKPSKNLKSRAGTIAPTYSSTLTKIRNAIPNLLAEIALDIGLSKVRII